MRSPQLSFSRTVRAPQSEVWALLTDTESWPVWGPTMSAVECSDGVIKLGSTGRIRTPAGVWLPFEVTEFAPPPVGRWGWRVGPVAATTHRVGPDPHEPSSSIVSFDVPAWAAAYAPVCVTALGRIGSMLGDPDLRPEDEATAEPDGAERAG